MHRNVDPILAGRQVRETKTGLMKAANHGETDQEKDTSEQSVLPQGFGVKDSGPGP